MLKHATGPSERAVLSVGYHQVLEERLYAHASCLLSLREQRT